MRCASAPLIYTPRMWMMLLLSCASSPVAEPEPVPEVDVSGMLFYQQCMAPNGLDRGQADLLWLLLRATGHEGAPPEEEICRAAAENLATRTALDLSGHAGHRHVVDLAPLREAVALQELRIPKQQVSDLAPLANLTQLRVLVLDENPVTFLSSLGGLKQLRRLEIDGPRGGGDIHDLQAISKLTELRYLDLSDQSVGEVGALSTLTALEELRLYGLNNRILSVAPLADLNQLHTLGVNSDWVSDFHTLRPEIKGVLDRDYWLEAEQIVSFEVLDFNETTGEAAVRRMVEAPGFGQNTSQGTQWVGASIDCNYAGMSDHATAGVDLMRVKLGGGVLSAFTVYAVALKPEACTPEGMASEQLAAAKADFEAHGLDPSRKPSPIQGPDADDVRMSDEPVSEQGVAVTAGGRTFRVQAHDVPGETDELKVLTHEGTVLWAQTLDTNWDQLHVEQAYVLGDGFVFAVHANRYGVANNQDGWFLSPQVQMPE